MKQRVTPVKARAVETRELLLATARTVLDEVGFEGLTTALVAERAGVNIATLYRYFEDKTALVATLAKRDHSSVLERIDEVLDGAALSSFEASIELLLRQAGERHDAGMSGTPVRQALHASPVLWPVDAENYRDLIDLGSATLRQRRPDLGQLQAEAIGEVCVVAASAVLDLLGDLPVPNTILLAEVQRFLQHYSDAYLDGRLGPQDVPALEVVSGRYPLPIPIAQLRREPVQRRAVEAVEAILDATIDLLETVGYEGLTTALVAERAGVNIATVYRYFTDKASLVRVLTQRHLLDNRMTSLLVSSLDAEGADWREFMQRRFRQVASHVEIRQNLNALYRALQADPALRSVSLSWPVERARLLAHHLRANRPHLSEERAFAAAVMIVLGSVSVLVRLDRRPERAAAIVAELAAAMEIFISGI